MFLLGGCGGLTGGVSPEKSAPNVLLGIPFKLEDNFLSGRGDMLVDSTFEASELNQTPRESEAVKIVTKSLCWWGGGDFFPYL